MARAPSSSALSRGVGATYKGKYGSLALYVYVDWYVDDNDVLQPMLPDYSVIMGSPHVDGVRHYGAIMDPALGYQALPYAPKSWIDNDPPVRWLMLQSAPLPVPYRVNASFRATVR
ncbi:MAG: major capsid protein [Rhodospirillaceae bacterium]|nr:major capsid protein [Rhodospirillaceae bacterium]